MSCFCRNNKNNTQRETDSHWFLRSFSDAAVFILYNKGLKAVNMMYEKKQMNFKSPDLEKMQEVVINARTRIYIANDADPKEAKERYFSRLEFKKP